MTTFGDDASTSRLPLPAGARAPCRKVPREHVLGSHNSNGQNGHDFACRVKRQAPQSKPPSVLIMNELLAAYRYTSNNWAQVGASEICGCCNCMQLFAPDEIVAWAGLDMDNFDDPQAINQQTALCPRCGSESVLGDKSGFPIHAAFLSRMNEAWFQKTLIHKPAPRK